ncbi:unnamed protein product [Linum trigynum]|uniref:F-box domain-containing protein n=1 Tax=Linum trigynum TaxID=586398 RepID=A0AAV2D5U8_9ROSI
MNNDNAYGKRRRAEEEEEANDATTDRLSHLPTLILHHILSFLKDTKSVVRTSLLSRGWRNAWKQVPVLEFHRSSFRRATEFDGFVDRVLSLRRDLNLSKVVYDDTRLSPETPRIRKSDIIDKQVKVINYALSHDVRHLVVRSWEANERGLPCDFSSIFPACCNNGNGNDCTKKKKTDHLKTLDLKWIDLDPGFVACSVFPMLTTLNLERCEFGAEGLILPASIPLLTNLAITNCRPKQEAATRRTTKVYGPHLLTLKLNGGMGGCKIEVFAPKLESFTLLQDVTSEGFFNTTFPALDRADVALTEGHYCTKPRADHYLNSLFQVLCNAKSLKLDRNAFQILNNRCEFLEQQPSTHFKRLESLILPPNNRIIDYFAKASSCEKLNICSGKG